MSDHSESTTPLIDYPSPSDSRSISAECSPDGDSVLIAYQPSNGDQVARSWAVYTGTGDNLGAPSTAEPGVVFEAPPVPLVVDYILGAGTAGTFGPAAATYLVAGDRCQPPPVTTTTSTTSSTTTTTAPPATTTTSTTAPPTTTSTSTTSSTTSSSTSTTVPTSATLPETGGGVGGSTLAALAVVGAVCLALGLALVWKAVGR